MLNLYFVVEGVTPGKCCKIPCKLDSVQTDQIMAGIPTYNSPHAACSPGMKAKARKSREGKGREGKGREGKGESKRHDLEYTLGPQTIIRGEPLCNNQEYTL